MNTLQEKYSRTNYPDKLEEFYQGNIPEYILGAGKSFIKIRVSDWRGDQDLKITPKDVVEYYYRWADNITSGCRVIAGYAGAWSGSCLSISRHSGYQRGVENEMSKMWELLCNDANTLSTDTQRQNRPLGDLSWCLPVRS